MESSHREKKIQVGCQTTHYAPPLNPQLHQIPISRLEPLTCFECWTTYLIEPINPGATESSVLILLEMSGG